MELYCVLLAGEVFHGMGEHYALIPAETYKVQMIVRSIPEQWNCTVLERCSSGMERTIIWTL
jgi:hypothetical protein